MGTEGTFDILAQVQFERSRQDQKWGTPNHYPETWLAILMEEVGEAAQAMLERRLIDYRHEMVQVAAVALAALESYDRNESNYR